MRRALVHGVHRTRRFAVNVNFELRRSIREIGLALRRPEELAVRWRDEGSSQASPLLIPVLIANAAFGLAVYGLTMRMHVGFGAMLMSGVLAPTAAGLAWSLALPALYILGSQLGSKLTFSSTLLAASLTVSFGALAMLASVPVAWFFNLAVPFNEVRLLVHLTVFSGVGFCMADVFIRTMSALEPERSPFFSYAWLGLLSVIGSELFWLFGLFKF
jgi:hypothetical protein